MSEPETKVKLWNGSSRRTLTHNFHVYRHSTEFAAYARKYGKAAAVQHMDHVVLSKAGIPKKKS